MVTKNRMATEEPTIASIGTKEAHKELNKLVSMEDRFKAFQVISNHGDLAYINKLGKLLVTISDIMEKEDI